MMMTLDTEMDAANNIPMDPSRATEMVQTILMRRFPGDRERQTPIHRGERLNFCCPYCGDSKDPRNKRGNLYYTSMYFKCYNGGCEKRTGFDKMLEDFDMADSLTPAERVSIKLQKDEAKKSFGSGGPQIAQNMRMQSLMDIDIYEYLIPRDALAKALGLVEVDFKSPVGVYLNKRCQPLGKHFMWDPNRKRLFMFNMDTEGEKIFGLQTRQFDSNVGPKYKTYDISYIWTNFMKRNEPEFLEKLQKMDKVSTLFGILRADLSVTVTVFEGPMDHFLFRNSVATCSINNDLPFEQDGARWMQDNDQAGKKKALEYIQKGRSVFMWKKFLHNNEVINKVKDFNDLITLQAATGKDLGLRNLDNYFTKNKLDTINI